MMRIDDFKKELFSKLLAARTIKHKRLISIGKDLFSAPIEDLTVYMDSEMQMMVTLYPYRVAYVSCESNKDNLVFIDILPDVSDINGVIQQTFYYYDCEKHRVCSFVQFIEP